MAEENLTPSDTPELQPDAAELMGVEDLPDPWFGIKVGVTRVDDPVRVKMMPHRGLATREFTVPNDISGLPAVRILERDPRRARAIITSNSVFMIAPNQAAAMSPGMRAQIGGFGLPQYELGTTEEVWASAGGGGGSVLVWVVQEQWAE